MRRFFPLLMALLVWSLGISANAQTPHIGVLTVEGPIGPATTDYLARAMREAHESGARAVVIRMDTPGGLDAATRDIIQNILAFPIPVITYVHPSGARAASAGTYILYASHIAAMTPATALGAATPVQMGGGQGGREDSEKTPETEDQAEEKDLSGSAMDRKMINDAVAFIRGLAARHGRNADWAERAVREAVSLTAEDALAEKVVDIVARDVEDLLAQAHGREVQMATGALILDVDNLPTTAYEPNWRNELLALITNPQVAYILLLIGIYGLIFEGYSPGAMVPGIVGVISLLVAFYALQVLPVNYAGLALIVVGAILIASEAFVPTFGVLGIGGVVALVIGSVMLMDTEVPGMMVSPILIGSIGGISALVVLGVLFMVGRSLRIPRPKSGEELVGQAASVIHSDGDDIQVKIAGEIWRAQSREKIAVGDRVRVTAQDGLTLTIERDKENQNV